MRKYIIKSFLIALFLILIFQHLSFCEEKYYPYPIIFVHGIASDSRAWDDARKEFRNYFYLDQGQGELKYFPIGDGYLRVYDYGFQNNGDVNVIAQGLQAVISKALGDLPLPDEEKKVIIVAHSMGGIVTRSFLEQYPSYDDDDKIDKIVFIGTPHEGSPLASVVILVKREIPKIQDEMRINWAYEALDLLRVILNPVDRKNVKAYYHTLTVQMAGALLTDATILKISKDIINVDHSKYNPKQRHNQGQGVAVGQLVVPATIITTRTFDEGLAKLSPIVVQSLYQQYDTFLNPASNNLFTPAADKVVTIYGTNGSITGSFLDLLEKAKIIPNFQGFPRNNGLIELSTRGDGVVTTMSQTAINAATEYSVHVWHLDEPKEYQTILQAIDDMPQIERIRVIAEDATQNNLATPHYVIFKIKEYLLADLEVLSLKLDGTNVFPGDGYNPVYKYGDDFQSTDPYKPYDVYPEKGFLKERDVPNAFVTDIEGTETPLHLYPGEFHIMVNLTYGKHEIKIKLKNPADKETDELTYYISMPKIYNLYNTTTYYYVSGDGARYPQEVDHGYINVAPFQPTKQPDDAWIDTKTKISFSIADELFNQFKVDVWIYDRYGHTLIRKLYQKPVTLSGSEGNYYGNFQTFHTWDGKDDNGNDVPDQSYYKVKIIARPVDDSYILPQSDPPHLKQCLIATSQDYPNQDLIYADPSFVQASREPQDLELISENEKSFFEDKLYASTGPNTIIDITDLSNKDLTCKIQVPFPNSLVRADVPIFGLAYGKDFKQYKLEYGEGLNPTTWKQILTSTKPHVDTRLIKEIASAGATIRGNLGTWDTGLTEYEHNNKKHQADLNGLYTLKLTVTDTHGNIKEDKITVQVGRVVSFAFGGKATSPDGKAEVIIPEHSIKDSFEVMGISEVDDASIKEKDSLKSKLYKIIPEEYFTEPATLKIKLDSDYKENLSDLKICAFDMAKGARFLLPTEVDLKENMIYANVNYLSSSNCYAAAEVRDDEPAPMYPARGEPPNYEIALTKEPFDMRQQPIVTFDYKCDPDAKVDLKAKVGKRYYDIQIKDDPKSYLKNNLKKAGKIDGFIADGKTHNIKIDLYAFLSRFSSTTTVEELTLADLDASGYMDLHPGRSNLKESVSVENIRLEKRSGVNRLAARSKDPSWNIGIHDNDPAEFELENNADKNYSIGAPFDKFNRAITPDVPVSNINFNLTRAQSKGSYVFTLDAISADTSKKGYVRFKVLLNGKPLETLQASHWAGELFQIPIRDGLKKGKNTLTLQWLDGGSWVTWDYLSFQQL